MLVGLFSPTMEVTASPANPNEPCVYRYGVPTNSPCVADFSTKGATPSSPDCIYRNGVATNPPCNDKRQVAPGASGYSGGGATLAPATSTSTGAGTNPPAKTNTSYQLLTPLPCETGKDPGCENGKLTAINTASGLGSYLNLMIKIFIGICAVLSVVMIVMGGLEYMTSELISSKEAGKDRIVNALIGLVIALGAYALLFTINPDLLKSDATIPATAPAPATTPSPSP